MLLLQIAKLDSKSTERLAEQTDGASVALRSLFKCNQCFAGQFHSFLQPSILFDHLFDQLQRQVCLTRAHVITTQSEKRDFISKLLARPLPC